jgi:hypothetical protein
MDWPPYLFLLEWLLQSLCARCVRTFSSSNEAPLHVACALWGRARGANSAEAAKSRFSGALLVRRTLREGCKPAV